MEISAFEQEIKQIDNKLRVVPHPLYKDIAGVYYGSQYIDVAVPTGQIFDEKNKDYTDAYGFPHKTRPEAIAQIKHYLWRMQNEPDFMEV